MRVRELERERENETQMKKRDFGTDKNARFPFPLIVVFILLSACRLPYLLSDVHLAPP